ncbi:MAG: nucleotidyltransferase domain-containing protein [Planctomycetes bacterium]|nr:nucleotidyltransferase domain-containing protein [Planctomycetota bacterium]
MNVPAAVQRAVSTHPHPLLFATISGAHLYGFPSPDSDWDLRGCHVLPTVEFLGLHGPRDETIATTVLEDGVELDLVTHDLRKFVRMLSGPNGYVLEQVLSPIVLATSDWHAELAGLARRSITSGHARHYRGFARNQRALLAKDSPPRVKPLLYVYRVLLTGIRLLRTGELCCDLNELIAGRDLGDVAELVDRKRSGCEDLSLDAREIERHAERFDVLDSELEAAWLDSPLPSSHALDAAFDDFVRRARAGP